MFIIPYKKMWCNYYTLTLVKIHKGQGYTSKLYIAVWSVDIYGTGEFIYYMEWEFMKPFKLGLLGNVLLLWAMQHENPNT